MTGLLAALIVSSRRRSAMANQAGNERPGSFTPPVPPARAAIAE